VQFAACRTFLLRFQLGERCFALFSHSTNDYLHHLKQILSGRRAKWRNFATGNRMIET